VSREALAPVAPRRRRYYHRCSCGRPIPEDVRRCSSRTCPEYAPTWARDTRRRLMENLRIVPLTVMFSVTAPGADLYPFDPRFCSHRPVTRCSGRLGCRVDPKVAEAFNRKAGVWWSQLHRAAKVRADRATATKGKVLARVWEKQRRGLAHVHGVVAVGTPAERAWAKAYVEALADLAPRYGFGYVDGWHKIGRKFWPGEQAARYLAAYLVHGRGRKATLTENARASDLPRLLVYVSRDLTLATGCTMRNLRLARRLWAWRAGLADRPAVGERTLDRTLALNVVMTPSALGP
jgi:predicted nucleic acid-binding Zn ribbon protein